MRFLFASLAVFSAVPAASAAADGSAPTKPYTLEDAIAAMVMTDVTVVTVEGRCIKDPLYQATGRYVPNYAGRAALRAAGLDQQQSDKFLAAACSSLPAFTVNLNNGISIIGTERQALNYVTRHTIGEYSTDVENKPAVQRANIMAHERGHAYFNSEGFNAVFDASSAGVDMANKGFSGYQSSPWLYANELRATSAVDELVADAFMICDAAAKRRPAAQTDILMNWRANEPSLSSKYRNDDILTPEFIKTIQAACAPLGPQAPGERVMETTAGALLAGPWNYLLK